ncbi:hypothetical protein Vadar_030263 [Vaccinium darrowii]|uniref:Uncharacterized protein n=1 Tax=Vaccinium darrowii TaxID=229202 RepID=A0ACB7YGV4_9ERIC|nr:hypothetical protein Vadar_030263 [Vaccinium darrowii]
MESHNSYGASWANQWDNSPNPLAAELRKSSGSGSAGKKVGEGLGKTKAVASSEMKKVKEWTTGGIQWIKDNVGKYDYFL